MMGLQVWGRGAGLMMRGCWLEGKGVMMRSLEV